MNNNKLQKKKKVTFSEFNRVYIIPNRYQLKLLEYDPLALDKEILINKEKKKRFVVSTIEDNSEKT
jgi:hypothetical protein